eukprot:8855536-Lingulodinium_polyedra.AAC.1
MGATWKTWTGATLFFAATMYPHIPMEDRVDVARTPNMAATPQEPTQQQRALHELTRTPYRN